MVENRFKSVIFTKEIVSRFKMKIKIGSATPQPPIGSSLGQRGISAQEFCKKYNDYCDSNLSQYKGDFSLTEMIIFSDRSYEFRVSKPTVPSLIKKKFSLNKGGSLPGKSVVLQVSIDDLKEIAEEKIVDMSARSVDSALKIVVGTARSMGIKVVG